jgi:hypothetical protein
MSRISRSILAAAAIAGGFLPAASDYPLAINLPTAERMQFWDIGLAFTHRFDAPVQGHGKDVYGLDGYAYPGLGFAFGIKPVKGLNVLVYRTADNKTFTLGLQQQLLDGEVVRCALRAERFDEVVTRTVTPRGTVGISGGVVQLPTDVFLGEWAILTVVPTWLSRTTSQDKAVFTAGALLRIPLTEKFSFMGEYYPRPSRLAGTYSNGFAAGCSYKTFKHRFTVVGSNVTGTTANQVLSGDYGGGARPGGKWALGFNVARIF